MWSRWQKRPEKGTWAPCTLPSTWSKCWSLAWIVTCPVTCMSWSRDGCVFRWPESLTEKTCWCQSLAPKRNSSRCGEAVTWLYFKSNASSRKCISSCLTLRSCPQALVCSCFIPIYCGLIPPSFRGVVGVCGWILPQNCVSQYLRQITTNNNSNNNKTIHWEACAHVT